MGTWGEKDTLRDEICVYGELQKGYNVTFRDNICVCGVMEKGHEGEEDMSGDEICMYVDLEKGYEEIRRTFSETKHTCVQS